MQLNRWPPKYVKPQAEPADAITGPGPGEAARDRDDVRAGVTAAGSFSYLILRASQHFQPKEQVPGRPRVLLLGSGRPVAYGLAALADWAWSGWQHGTPNPAP
jgi:hypothetical protein